MKINLLPGDKIQINRTVHSDGKRGCRVEKVKYKVLEIYQYFVLCERIPFGYRECFGAFQLQGARKI